MAQLPTGTVTFLFTDIEGSTRLWEEHPELMRAALARHDAVAAAAVEGAGGTLVKARGEGDSLFAVFARAPDAAAAAFALQAAFVAECWPTPEPLRVRMALHTAEAEQRDQDYYGPAVNRCARLRAVAHGGQVLLSGATRELVQAPLPAGASLRDLGAHRLRDLQRPEQVFQLVHPELPADFPPLRSLSAWPNNLPQQISSFVGREREIREVKRLLEETRLLTLTGVGGTGKTRLALQAAADLLDGYGDGIWLVELAPLSDPELVPQAVAAALGLKEEGGAALLQTLTDYLRTRQLLLILDNCEHLLDACARLADTLLRASSDLRLLATSRETLGLTGEQTYRVPSLRLPVSADGLWLMANGPNRPARAPGSSPSAISNQLSAIAECESVRLFVERAALSRPGFALTPENAAAVVQVCHRLDGIPLALELAAARVKALPVEQLAGRLDDRFRLLTGGSRAALPRQQTLRALIDWSYDLLSEEEKILLRRLSAFAGGCTLAAAEAVCGCEDVWVSGCGSDTDTPTHRHTHTPIQDYEVLDLLTQLVEKSLVLYEEREGEPRYRMLETIRQYSRDRLLEAGEAEALRQRHLAFFLSLAEEAEPALRASHDQPAWLDRLEAEHDNLRAAMDWGLSKDEGHAKDEGGRMKDEAEPSEPGSGGSLHPSSFIPHPSEAALRLAGALWGYLCVHGHFTEGRGWLEAALRASPEGAAEFRAKAFTGAGSVAWCQCDYDAAVAFHQQALVLYRELEDRPNTAFALNNLSAQACEQGDFDLAARLAAEGLEVAREVKDEWLIAILIHSLAEPRLFQRRLSEAVSLYEEAMETYRRIGASRDIGGALEGLGAATAALGDHDRAAAAFREGVALARELGDRRMVTICVDRLAAVYQEQGRLARAARLFGAAEGLREEVGIAVMPNRRAEYESSIRSLQAALGPEAFTAHWGRGRAMALEELLSYALAEPDDG